MNKMLIKLLYLHGFRSSPQSFKAQVIAKWMQDKGLEKDWACPQLNLAPHAAITVVRKILDHWLNMGVMAKQIVIIGSSLGGFYATWLAEQYGCRCVLLNPAVTPWQDLHEYLGEQPLWHGGGSITVEAHYMDELKSLSVPAITLPQRYFLIAATGDEIIDYRTMLTHYLGARIRLIQGDNHGLSTFPDYLDEVFAFCLDETNEFS